MGFRVGEKVVYPNHGVSVVEKIGEGFVTNSAPVSPRSFYHLRLLANNSKVMVPIGNTDHLSRALGYAVGAGVVPEVGVEPTCP